MVMMKSLFVGISGLLFVACICDAADSDNTKHEVIAGNNFSHLAQNTLLSTLQAPTEG